MSIRTWAVKTSLKTATSLLKLDQISFPNDLASGLTKYPKVVEKNLYVARKHEGALIVVEKGRITFIENSNDPRDSVVYGCKSLPVFMYRYFSRKIDFACTIEMARLEMERLITGNGKLTNQEFVARRQEIKSLLTEKLKKYLRSSNFKYHTWLARI
jgi:hypothetical protein